jgi:hypothetical protein
MAHRRDERVAAAARERAGDDANARGLISGEPGETLDALADACNEAFPI